MDPSIMQEMLLSDEMVQVVRLLNKENLQGLHKNLQYATEVRESIPLREFPAREIWQVPEKVYQTTEHLALYGTEGWGNRDAAVKYLERVYRVKQSSAYLMVLELERAKLFEGA